MTLERAEESDLAGLLEIEAQANPHPWSSAQLLESIRQRSLWIVRGEHDQSEGAGPSAFCIARRAGDELEIHELAVRVGSRRRGLARQLLSSLLDLERAQGCAMAWLEVRAGNLPARALYQSLGFSQAGRRAGYYSEPREDAVVLRLSLSPSGPEA